MEGQTPPDGKQGQLYMVRKHVFSRPRPVCLSGIVQHGIPASSKQGIAASGERNEVDVEERVAKMIRLPHSFTCPRTSFLEALLV